MKGLNTCKSDGLFKGCGKEFPAKIQVKNFLEIFIEWKDGQDKEQLTAAKALQILAKISNNDARTLGFGEDSKP